MKFLLVTQTQILMPIKIEGFFENKLRPSVLCQGVPQPHARVSSQAGAALPPLPRQPGQLGLVC